MDRFFEAQSVVGAANAHHGQLGWVEVTFPSRVAEVGSEVGVVVAAAQPVGAGALFVAPAHREVCGSSQDIDPDGVALLGGAEDGAAVVVEDREEMLEMFGR